MFNLNELHVLEEELNGKIEEPTGKIGKILKIVFAIKVFFELNL